MVVGTENGRVEGRSASTGEPVPPKFQIGKAPIEHIVWDSKANAVLAIDERTHAALQRLDPLQTSPVMIFNRGMKLRGVTREPAAFNSQGNQLFGFEGAEAVVKELARTFPVNEGANLNGDLPQPDNAFLGVTANGVKLTGNRQWRLHRGG